MKNLFCIIYNKDNQKIEAEYKNYIIRQVSKKQEEKIQSLSQKYNNKHQQQFAPRWIYTFNRIFGPLLLISFIFLIVSIISDRLPFSQFLKENIGLIIIFCVSAFIVVSSTIVIALYKAKRKKENSSTTAEDIFQSILNVSKDYLGIPANAVSIEILSYQANKKNDELKVAKHLIYNNIVLSVFIEKDMLCFADLFDVIGIPLSAIERIEEVEESYFFQYWHKKEKFSTCGIKSKNFPVLHFEAQVYQRIVLKLGQEDFEIRLPAYELNTLNQILKG